MSNFTTERSCNEGAPKRSPGQAWRRRSHFGDAGFTSFLAVFYCLFAALPVFSDSADSVSGGWVFPASFLTFIGSICIALLFLSVFQLKINLDSPLIRKHSCKLAAALMAIGPAALFAEFFSEAAHSLLLMLCFAASGVGYGTNVIAWGRILSSGSEPETVHQVVADSCAATILMMIVALTPTPFNMLVIVVMCLTSGVFADRLNRNIPQITFDTQIVLSDTRNAIPKYSYAFAGMLWLVFGLSWSTWSGDAVFGSMPNVPTFLAIAIAAIGVVAILSMHKGWSINVERIFWLSGSLTVAGLAMLATDMRLLTNLAIVLLVVAMIIAGIQLWSHFALLSRRENMIPEQMFGWGWLSPFLGLFVGIVIGITCSMTDSAFLKSFAPSLAGVFTLAVIVVQRNIDNLVKKNIADKTKHDDADQRNTANEKLKALFSEKGLTEREAQVAALLLQGRSQPVIAEQLFVATSTINTHVKHIYQKFGVRSKQELIDACEKALAGS